MSVYKTFSAVLSDINAFHADDLCCKLYLPLKEGD